MSDDWRSWKVGDRLRCKERIFRVVDEGDIVTLTYTGNSSTGRGLIHYKKSNGTTLGCPDYAPNDNPSTYFLWLGPLPSWSVGDRVQRVDDAEISPKGTFGTVTEVTDKDIAVQWDNLSGSMYYQLPIHPLLFIKISTGQSPRPVLHCERCGEYNEWAEPNTTQSTYRCYQCRKDRFR